MKYTHTCFTVVLSLLLLLSCSKPTTDSETVISDTTFVGDEPIDEGDATEGDEIDAMREVIDYYNPIDTDAETALSSFTPFDEVIAAAKKAVHFKDSLEFKRETMDLLDPNDSALFMPLMNTAHELILAYQKAMKQSPKTDEQCPKLSDIVRLPGGEDKTDEILPEAGEAGFLTDKDFFFMGGAPFISRVDGAFKGPAGKAEIHYTSDIPENATYLLKAMRCRDSSPLEITFGPELSSYDSGPQEVYGVGSLLHTFTKRLPVIFITTDGPVDGQLISISIPLFERYGCASNQPESTFASASNIDPGDILGIYIPYSTVSLSNMKAERPHRSLWTADLNGDGVADLACVTGYFAGAASDTMAEVLWFVNIGGSWKVIDSGSEVDCT